MGTNSIIRYKELSLYRGLTREKNVVRYTEDFLILRFFILRNNRSRKCHNGTSHSGASSPRLLYRRKNSTSARNLATVSCKRRFTHRTSLQYFRKSKVRSRRFSVPVDNFLRTLAENIQYTYYYSFVWKQTFPQMLVRSKPSLTRTEISLKTEIFSSVVTKNTHLTRSVFENATTMKTQYCFLLIMRSASSIQCIHPQKR